MTILVYLDIPVDHVKNDMLKSYKIRKEVKEATHITIDIGANDFLSILKTNPDLVVAFSAHRRI